MLGRDIGEKAEAAAIDADERNVARGDIARRVQQGAIAADGDHEVGAVSDLALVDVCRVDETACRIRGYRS